MSDSTRWKLFLASTAFYFLTPTALIILIFFDEYSNERNFAFPFVVSGILLPIVTAPIISLLLINNVTIKGIGFVYRYVIPISTTILFAVLSILVTFYITESVREKIVFNAANANLESTIEELETHSLRRGDIGKIDEKQYLLFFNCKVPVEGESFGHLVLTSDWVHLYYPSTVIDELERGRLKELPSLIPKLAVIISQGNTVFDRMIELDVGSVPGLRRSEIITLIDIQNSAILRQSDPVLGSRPALPFPWERSEGLTVYSNVIGEEPSWSQRNAAIKSILAP